MKLRSKKSRVPKRMGGLSTSHSLPLEWEPLSLHVNNQDRAICYM